ncbi:MAG: carbohydrate ABC transporter permease [Chloroflexota bacterium]
METKNVTTETTKNQTPRAGRNPKRSGLNRRHLGNFFLYVVIIALLAIFILPIFWLLISSLKAENDFVKWPPIWLPAIPQWNNYLAVFTNERFNFLTQLYRSVILALLFAVPNVLFSAFAGYGFARINAPGKNILFIILLAEMMIPQTIMIFPQYVIFSRVGLIDNPLLWFLWGIAGTPFQILLFRQFFAAFPKELEDAAAIDGAGPISTFIRIFLPNARPVLAITFLFAFQWVWGDYLNQQLFLTTNSTLAMSLATAFVNPRGYSILTLTMAGMVIYTLPLVVLFFFMQRQLVQGIVTTGLKG